MTPRHSLLVPIATAGLLALTSCGGGGGSTHPSPDPGAGRNWLPPAYAGSGTGAATGPDGNTFVDEGTSGPVDTATDPRSTFALDVDNGSYRIAQAMVAQGQRPPAASVRPEEWVNAFSYGDPAPTDADLAVTAESGVTPGWDAGSQVVRVAVTARDVPPAERPSVNLVLVVDRSGSMAMGDRLELVKHSLGLLADSLRPDDTVSVVAFNEAPELLLPPTPVEDRETVLGALDDLEPDGSTNLAGGLELGYEQARQAYREGGINVVVLCSDGVANVGMTGPDGIATQIAEQGRRGIHLVTVGYGMGNYNDDLMEQLADQGNGFYRYVDSDEEAEHVYVDELTGLLDPVADDARAQVVFDPELVRSYRLVGYQNRAMADDSFGDLDADAGELSAGHHASALYEVRLAPGVAPGTPIGLAKVLWKSPGTGEPGFATAAVVAADPGAPLSDSLALATTAADLAAVVRGAGPATLDDVRASAAALAEREVPGAGDLLQLADRLASLG